VSRILILKNKNTAWSTLTLDHRALLDIIVVELLLPTVGIEAVGVALLLGFRVQRSTKILSSAPCHILFINFLHLLLLLPISQLLQVSDDVVLLLSVGFVLAHVKSEGDFIHVPFII
jgi:hypothetical protein